MPGNITRGLDIMKKLELEMTEHPPVWLTCCLPVETGYPVFQRIADLLINPFETV